MKLKSQLLATSLASLANTQTSDTAIITVEASHGGAGSGLTNTTLSIPLLTQYTNPALDAVSTLYLTGSTGDVQFSSITCYTYRNDNLTGMGGLPFTSETPSRLSTNTVVVGSIFCNSTDTTAKESGASPTSTLSATTTDLTRGSTSDVPNLNSTTMLSVTTSSSSPSFGGNGTATRTYESLVPVTAVPTSTGGAAMETVTSVSVVSGGSNAAATSSMLSAVGASQSASLTGAAVVRQVEGWGMAAIVLGVVFGGL